MNATENDLLEIRKQAERRAQRIAEMVADLQGLRAMQAVDARYLVVNTDLSRSDIGKSLGVTRPTLEKWLLQGGITPEYLASRQRRLLSASRKPTANEGPEVLPGQTAIDADQANTK
jgi:hypothetical protein